MNVVSIALCAVLSEADSFSDLKVFDELERDWPGQFLNLELLNLEQGMPSHDTFARVLGKAALLGQNGRRLKQSGTAR